jgi:hypothetical protein
MELVALVVASGASAETTHEWVNNSSLAIGIEVSCQSQELRAAVEFKQSNFLNSHRSHSCARCMR